MNWLRRQYDDIKGHFKWALLGPLWAGVTWAANRVLHMIPNMPTWAVWTIVLVGSFVVFDLLAARTHYRPPPPTPTRPTEVEYQPSLQVVPDAFGDVVIPTAPMGSQGLQTAPLSFLGTVKLFTSEISVGNFQHFGKVKIDVREIRKHILKRPGEGDYGAVLYVDTGGGLVWGGEGVTKINVNCYYLPLNPIAGDKEPYSVYFHHFTDQHFSAFAIYLEHINPHSGVVTMKACVARS